MKKICLLLAVLFASNLIANDQITGFWQTIDKQTRRPSSVIAIYQYQGKYYARIIGTFNAEGEIDDSIYAPKSRAPGLAGNPYYCGLDFVWVGRPNIQGKCSGRLVDPRDGKMYDARIWRENQNVILRGELFMFGRNEVWPPFPEANFTVKFKKPDLATFVPSIPASY